MRIEIEDRTAVQNLTRLQMMYSLVSQLSFPAQEQTIKRQVIAEAIDFLIKDTQKYLKPRTFIPFNVEDEKS